MTPVSHPPFLKGSQYWRETNHVLAGMVRDRVIAIRAGESPYRAESKTRGQALIQRKTYQCSKLIQIDEIVPRFTMLVNILV